MRSCQVTEQYMVVPVIIIGFLKWLQEYVEQVSGRNLDAIHECFLGAIEFMEVLFDSCLKARYLFVGIRHLCLHFGEAFCQLIDSFLSVLVVTFCAMRL